MTEAELSVSDLRKMFAGKPLGTALEYALAPTHAARLVAVRKAIDFACNQLEKHKHKKQGFGEDAITLEICEMLNSAGFDAAHDKDNGGHCDIVVEGNDQFLWLAEAKEHSSYEWLSQGFKQLSERYSTGAVGQDNGEILVYCYTTNAKAMLDKWRERLAGDNPDVEIMDFSCGNPLMFQSTHKHHATGLDFHIRHKAVALHWNPKGN